MVIIKKIGSISVIFVVGVVEHSIIVIHSLSLRLKTKALLALILKSSSLILAMVSRYDTAQGFASATGEHAGASGGLFGAPGGLLGGLLRRLGASWGHLGASWARDRAIERESERASGRESERARGREIERERGRCSFVPGQGPCY